jgi:ADP-ribose pyrophosphatase YjhB (NUDIX family)
MSERPPRWLKWAREIQALAQTGLHYARNEFERQRAQRLLEIAAEIASENGDMSLPEVLRAFREQPGYVTPKVDVRGAVFEAGGLLLVRESVDNNWTMPGGWADVGETPRQAVEREVWEESGLEVHAERLIGVYDANRDLDPIDLFHAYKLVFLCRREGGQPKSSLETLEVRFFDLDGLPANYSGSRTTTRHISDAVAVLENPRRPVVFD